MKFENCYISSNANQVPSVAHWGKNNLICYGACNSVLIYDLKYGGGKVTHSLVGHSKRVNSVKWLTDKENSYETELVSGSTDSSVIVWTLKDGIYQESKLLGHESSVNIVDGLYKGREMNNAIVVSASMDCTIKIWRRQTVTDDFKLDQSINFEYNISVGLKLHYFLYYNNLILICGLDTSNIQLYLENEDSDNKIEFKSPAKLEGHGDWVRGIDCTMEDGDLLIASGSQDTIIRLWRISNNIPASTALAQIRFKDEEYNICLESILKGHDGWIYSVNWSPTSFQLLSASIDKSVIIWEFDKNSRLWAEKIRVGEVGGNTLGFYGGVFGPDGNKILAYSYHGAFHIWTHLQKVGKWESCVTVGGHFSEVIDCAWEPKGEFLISVSADQTTRVHAPWPNNKEPITWHELARPQIHGYDLSSLAILSRYKFASGAEEKIIRVFEAPRNFVVNFRKICQINEPDDEEEDSKTNIVQDVPKGASVPSLGLSNKAVYEDNNEEQALPHDPKNPYPEESYFKVKYLTEPPTEETLIENTLWPEIEKLYGHGYEVYSLAASPDGKLLASACKSTTAEHAAILIWDTTSWMQIQKLMSHNLTVVQIQFSPDSKHLLSVSRDRRWSLFTKNDEDQFVLTEKSNKTMGVHSRIIWTCSWSHDSKFFVTGSRDGIVAVWTANKEDRKEECTNASVLSVLKNKSVTAAAFAPDLISGSYLIAIGLELGEIHLYKWNPGDWKEVLVLSKSFAHHLTVKRLCFRPVFGKAGYKEDKNVLQLASCSSDYSVRIYNIFIVDN